MTDAELVAALAEALNPLTMDPSFYASALLPVVRRIAEQRAAEALRDVLAAAARDAEKVRRVEAEVAAMEKFGAERDRDNETDDSATAASAAAYLRSAYMLRRALDPS